MDHAGAMRLASRRRLTLAPCWSLPPPAETGSRFSWLGSTDAEEVVHAVQDSSIDASTLQPLAVRRRKTDDELAQEFWADIRYPTPTSRVWERT